MQQTLVQAFALRRSSETAGNALSSLGYPGPPFRASAPLQGPPPLGCGGANAIFAPSLLTIWPDMTRRLERKARICGARSASILHFSLAS